ncbi:chemotaxis protein CheY [Acetobacter malorum DSM 14337]|uniref:Chemotaxis protein CheY n=1 Tax=Acetobacter malorum DSM 14337 TaxID=1307910 RepID=A0ABQ0PZ60_9PROT|nr:response regulator [Acetobacter malorum]KXV05614.1 chemotaxis protein CheY [Acetobacter malorum]GBQ85229.1 chemotaxis protein CheY [Acetobacter malorum DSM 14337]
MAVAASQIRALIVDDQQSIRQTLASNLQELKFVHIAQRPDGKSALEYLKEQVAAKQPVHLVISDYNMPEMNGLELLKAVRGDARTQKTAFVMLTGEASNSLVQECIDARVNNFIAKPYTVAKLREVLEKVFGTIR